MDPRIPNFSQLLAYFTWCEYTLPANCRSRILSRALFPGLLVMQPTSLATSASVRLISDTSCYHSPSSFEAYEKVRWSNSARLIAGFSTSGDSINSMPEAFSASCNSLGTQTAQNSCDIVFIAHGFAQRKIHSWILTWRFPKIS